MDLYFSPMACSLASRISLYEAGAKDVQFVEVDPKTKRTMARNELFRDLSAGPGAVSAAGGRLSL